MSRLIKAAHYYTLDDIKLIEIEARSFRSAAREGSIDPEQMQALQREQEQLREQLLRDAEAMAEVRLQEAAEQANELRDQTAKEIEAWWEARRLEDEQAAAEARQQGYEGGYRQGIEQAEAAVREEYSDMLEQARSVLEHATAAKARIIQEAEPFLVELSCAIAEKVLQKQLTLTPDWAIQIARSSLQRRRERGVITLCVAPQQFSLFQEAREELMLAVDPQAELQIIPDASVSDAGCVIRSLYGSIDARFDTQLREIKLALQQLAFAEEGATGADE